MSEDQIAPDVFTADYVGTPGERTFYLQSRSDEGAHTYLVEKQQVAVLAEKLREILIVLDQNDTIRAAVPARDPALAMSGPPEPRWRVGTIGLGYDEDADRIVLLLQEITAEDESGEGEEPAPEEEVASVRLSLRRDQARAFVLHAVAVVGEGRPTCQLCGLPMDPAGHICPASNGHRLTIV